MGRTTLTGDGAQDPLDEARDAIEMALTNELPPILLSPLRWLEQDRPDFYAEYVVPLLARFDVGYGWRIPNLYLLGVGGPFYSELEKPTRQPYQSH